MTEHCLCGHEHQAHGNTRCYYETECGCVEYAYDSGRDAA